MLTLWDLIEPIRRKLRPKVDEPAARRERQAGEASRDRRITPGTGSGRGGCDRARGERTEPGSPSRGPGDRVPQRGDAKRSMQDKYDAVVRLHLEQYQVRVRKWRGGMSGIAWYVTYRDGRIQRLIEAPRPKGPMSAAVFLHEIGHHAIGFDVYKPRCLEEYHAWRWALEAMERHNLNITDAVRRRMHLSLWYAVQKARRRGIKQIPAELAPFLEKPPRTARGVGARKGAPGPARARPRSAGG
ncbi:MAG: hypothetical protein ACK4WH_09105 [Phycisphaerales bacterium]